LGERGFGSWLENHRQRKLSEDPSAATVVTAAGFVGRIALWAVVLLLVLDNLGVEVTALIAGLGSAESPSLLRFRTYSETRSPLSRSFSTSPSSSAISSPSGAHGKRGDDRAQDHTAPEPVGEQLVFSNNDLLSSRIRNYGRMAERRVAFTIGVTYQTPREQLRKIPQILREAVESEEQTRFDRAHFKTYGDFRSISKPSTTCFPASTRCIWTSSNRSI